MDEQTNKPVAQTTQPLDQTAQAVQPTQQTTPLATPTGQQQNQYPVQYNSTIQAQPAENLPNGVSDYSAQIQQMYDAQMAAKAQSLEDAYNQNLEAMQYAKSQIDPQFIAQGNDLATQYERTRRNNNLRADMNGLNTGAASQMDLAQQSNYLNSFGQIRSAQAKAQTEADRQIANLEVSYKSAVAQALADNDYQKATALLQEYQRRDAAAEEMRRYNQQQALADAKLRAAYGDFGGYESLYGSDVSKTMREYWVQSNPNYAYANGLISASQYKKLTGRDAPGTSSSTKYVRGYDPGDDDKDDDKFGLEFDELELRDHKRKDFLNDLVKIGDKNGNFSGVYKYNEP